MRPPVRPPQLRCVFFSSMYLPHLLVLPATFWTSVPFATLSVFPSLICGSCPSGQRFAYSFFQIPSHGGHPCCSAMCFVVAYAHLGLSPIRKRPCWANKIPGKGIIHPPPGHSRTQQHLIYSKSIIHQPANSMPPALSRQPTSATRNPLDSSISLHSPSRCIQYTLCLSSSGTVSSRTPT